MKIMNLYHTWKKMELLLVMTFTVIYGTDIIEAEIVTPSTDPVVYLYTESDKWDLIKIDDGEWILFGPWWYTSDTIPFSLLQNERLQKHQQKPEFISRYWSQPSSLYTDNGTWEKIGVN